MQALRETGATGLEPATSGLTGHFEGRQVNDDGFGIVLFMRLFGLQSAAPAWLRERRRDVCCPCAARKGSLDTRSTLLGTAFRSRGAGSWASARPGAAPEGEGAVATSPSRGAVTAQHARGRRARQRSRRRMRLRRGGRRRATRAARRGHRTSDQW